MIDIGLICGQQIYSLVQSMMFHHGNNGKLILAERLLKTVLQVTSNNRLYKYMKQKNLHTVHRINGISDIHNRFCCFPVR